MSPTEKNVAKYREFAKLPINERIESVRFLVRRLVRKRVPRKDAEDVEQSVFADLLAMDAKWNPERGSYTTWIGWRVRHIVSEYRRHKDRLPRPFDFGNSGNAFPEIQSREQEAADAVDELARIEHAQQAVKRILGILGERERAIVSMRFGLNGEPQFLEEVATRFGLTKERVRQIQVKAFDTIRHRMARVAEEL